MARIKSQYICQSCGAVSGRWVGRCESCGEWNTITEESGASTGGASSRKARSVELVGLKGEQDAPPRIVTALHELDRVSGGGFVPGSVLLVGGDPGIGKSTLLLQAAAAIEASGGGSIYVSGEEAIAQVRLRAERLGLTDAAVRLAAETQVEAILATLARAGHVDLVIIDSIQTMWTDSIESAPGTVSQVRAASQALIRYAKRSATAMVLVGHVTKDGQIAGPRVVEHMVDAVLYFEGDHTQQYRILRAVKNRFGPTDEIGVFEMAGAGLRQVANPSALFLGEGERRAPGMAVFAGMEGSRPLLVEVQALVARSSLATPRRAVNGWDSNRLAMILAVLEARCGMRFGGHDVYLNVAGGLRLNEPAADLAAAAAIISSMAGKSLPSDMIFFGEVSLSGAVRKISRPAARLKEAEKLGFTAAMGPTPSRVERADLPSGVRLHSVKLLVDLVSELSAGGYDPQQRPQPDRAMG